METELYVPKTLQEAIVFYSDEQNCLDFIVAMRWPNGICCPRCGAVNVTLVERKTRQQSRTIWMCNGCRKQFSAKVGTIFEDSPLPLGKWLAAMWLLTGAKNGISSCELSRALGVTQKTAWFMLHRVREAISLGSIEKFYGKVEVDETVIGGSEKFKHKNKRTSKHNKTVVQAFLERGNPSKVQAIIVGDHGAVSLKDGVHAHVELGTEVFTDGAMVYRGLRKDYVHEMVDHAYEYVRGNVHTNSLENYFSLLKRMLGGTYVTVEPYHLKRYIDELNFRFNARKGTDRDRFIAVARMIAGKRLDYKTLTSAYEEYYQQVFSSLG